MVTIVIALIIALANFLIQGGMLYAAIAVSDVPHTAGWFDPIPLGIEFVDLTYETQKLAETYLYRCFYARNKLAESRNLRWGSAVPGVAACTGIASFVCLYGIGEVMIKHFALPSRWTHVSVLVIAILATFAIYVLAERVFQHREGYTFSEESFYKADLIAQYRSSEAETSRCEQISAELYGNTRSSFQIFCIDKLFRFFDQYWEKITERDRDKRILNTVAVALVVVTLAVWGQLLTV